jgi:hypothetical protein
MSDEDDTYDKLRRTPAPILVNILFAMPRDGWYYLARDEKKREEFLNGHGWTYQEWITWIVNN